VPTFETPEPILAVVDVVVADVRIRARPCDTTTVEVTPSDPANPEDVRMAEQTRVEYTPPQLLVKSPKLRSWSIRSTGGSIDVTIELPAGSRVHGSGAMASFDADGPLGECRIKSGFGDIRLDTAETLELKSGAGDIDVAGVTGRAEINAGTGDVRVRELGDGAVIKNSNGATWVGAAVGDLRLTAANGSIAVEKSGASVVAKSANGDVRLGEIVRGSVVLETKMGDLEVGIPEGTAAWLDARATAGRVHNALDSADAPEGSAETAEVRARTVIGDILIRRPR
jgi:DUF4097 and DUF4098 domain-containing protein YvlB